MKWDGGGLVEALSIEGIRRHILDILKRYFTIYINDGYVRTLEHSSQFSHKENRKWHRTPGFLGLLVKW